MRLLRRRAAAAAAAASKAPQFQRFRETLFVSDSKEASYCRSSLNNASPLSGASGHPLSLSLSKKKKKRKNTHTQARLKGHGRELEFRR